jgi:AraC-like DNA-binding protein
VPSLRVAVTTPSEPELLAPTIQAAAAAGVLEYTARAGGDVRWVVSQAQLTLDDLARPENRLPLPKFVTLIEAASASTADDCFGLHLGQTCPLKDNGLPGYLATFAPTVGQALASFARYYYLLGEATDVRFERQGSRACFSYRVVHPRSWPRRQDAEQVIAMIVHLLRAWTDPGWAPESVCFEHSVPKQNAELERILGCRVLFDCGSNMVQFDAGLTEHRNPRADERLFQLLSWFAETVLADANRKLAFRDEVLMRIDACSHLGNASIHSVARSLNIEPRTLQRRLQAQGCSFRDLHEEYQRQQALELVGTSELRHEEIAHRLGYANLNSFIRAFRRWTNMTPACFRQHNTAVKRR